MPITLNGTLGIDAPLGTSSVPSYGNTTNTNTGLYFPTSTTLGLSTNGTAALTIDASQNVGIGTTSPAVKLDINGTNPSIRIVQTVGGYENYLGVDSGNLAWNGSTNGTSWGVKTNNVERMRIDTAGNVGIGTSSPGYKLDIQSSSATLNLQSTTTTSLSYLTLRNVGYNYVGVENSAGGGLFTGSSAYALALGTVSAYPIQFGTSGTIRATIDASGNVGIGTSSPSASLSVVKQTTALSGTGNSYGLYMYPTSSGLTYIDAITGSTGNTSLGFRTYNNGTYNEMRMDSSGNVGIGTSSPGYRLEVKGASGAQGYLSIHDGTGDTTVSGNNAASLLFQTRDTSIRTIAEIDAVNTTTNGTGGAMVFQTRISDTLAERMRIDSSGQLILKRSAAVNAATITCSTSQNSRQISFVNNNNNNEVGYIFCNNDGTTTQYATTSDYRLKENVQPITTGLATISLLKPVTYDWINNNYKGEGFIAHELQEHIPLAVNGTKDEVNEEGKPVYQGVDYSKIVVHLVAAIQELKAELDALKVTK